jgi:heterodisulfide reductase subunit D
MFGEQSDTAEIIPRKIKANVKSIMVNQNPYGVPAEDKAKWLEHINVPEKSENIYYFGCTAALKLPYLAEAMVAVLKGSSVEFGVLREEPCCGGYALRAGYWKVMINQASRLMEALKRAGAKRIMVTCAGCYRTLKKDYPEYLDGFDFEVVSAVEVAWELINSGRLKNFGPLNVKVTYHDPCHLGRHCGVYGPPREILHSIPGLEPLEASEREEASTCCGAGGGVRAIYPELSLKICEARVLELVKTGAETIVSACPFCELNMKDAVKELNLNVKVMDIIEILAEARKSYGNPH